MSSNSRENAMKTNAVATKRLGIGSEVKLGSDYGVKDPVIRKVVMIDKNGVTLDDGQWISREEVEFAVDASK
jgi:hypothetical protein